MKKMILVIALTVTSALNVYAQSANKLSCNIGASYSLEFNFSRQSLATSDFQLIPGSPTGKNARLSFVDFINGFDVQVVADNDGNIDISVLDLSTGFSARSSSTNIALEFSDRTTNGLLQNSLSVFCELN